MAGFLIYLNVKNIFVPHSTLFCVAREGGMRNTEASDALAKSTVGQGNVGLYFSVSKYFVIKGLY